MEGVSSSVLLVPAQSKSRRLAAKACWAAWVRMADQREERWKQTTFSMIPNTGDPTNPGNWRPFRFVSFRSLASVTHGHGTQALYWRCAAQKDCAKIFHCFKSENKASSRSAPPTTAVASLYTLDPEEFLGRPRRCGCSAIRGRRVWPENTHCLLTSVEGRAAIFPTSINWR